VQEEEEAGGGPVDGGEKKDKKATEDEKVEKMETEDGHHQPIGRMPSDDDDQQFMTLYAVEPVGAHFVPLCPHGRVPISEIYKGILKVVFY
jgi:hypothetical protein